MKRRGPLRRRTRLVGSRETYLAWQDRSRHTAREKAWDALEVATRPGESRARRLVRARSQGLCEIAIPDLCAHLATDWCHRRNRSQGGRWLASHGLHGCRPCHRATTNTDGRRAEYEANGWVLRRHQDPASTPVLIRGRFVLLDDNGGYLPADNHGPKGAAA